MKILRSVTPPFLALAIILIATWGLLRFALFFSQVFSASQPPVQAAIIAGSATVLVSVASLILNARYQTKREIEAEHRKQKAEIYEGFIKSWFELLTDSKENAGEPNEGKIMELVLSFSQRMIIWGSDDVINKYLAFKEQFGKMEEPDPIRMMRDFEGIIYAMRRDLGHDNKSLRERDLLSLFVNGLDEVWPVAK